MPQDSSEKCTAILYKRGSLRILDQLLLPEESRIVDIETVEDAWKAINTMQVRGAPAIAIVGSLCVAVQVNRMTSVIKENIHSCIAQHFDYLVTSRPTAVNLRNAAEELRALSKSLLNDPAVDGEGHKLKFIEACEEMLAQDINTNKQMGRFGADHILKKAEPNKKVNVLTVCNTGSLATAGYGTALGVIRSLHEDGRLENAYFAETRPYNQGERLTAYELATENIPATMICDNMVSFLMKKKNIDAVVVGADRVTANGDTANKIGTYQAAIAAQYHNVPFFVACPSTTVDSKKKTGDEIPIEERPAGEVSKRIKTDCWNPSFDVTPHQLITGFFTEQGVFSPQSAEWSKFVASIEKTSEPSHSDTD